METQESDISDKLLRCRARRPDGFAAGVSSKRSSGPRGSADLKSMQNTYRRLRLVQIYSARGFKMKPNITRDIVDTLIHTCYTPCRLARPVQIPP